MRSSSLRIALLCAALAAAGCTRIADLALLDGDQACGGVRARHATLAAARSTMRARMETDVDLVYHSVPGITVDSVTLPQMAAMAERIRGSWRDQDAESALALASLEARMHRLGCRSKASAALAGPSP
jgi:hypothetical protein